MYKSKFTGGKFVFFWDEANIEHISGHNVEPYEAEEAVTDVGRTGFDVHGKGSGKRGLIGKTEEGRFLIVIFAKRKEGIYVITAYDAHEDEKKIYRRRR